MFFCPRHRWTFFVEMKKNRISNYKYRLSLTFTSPVLCLPYYLAAHLSFDLQSEVKKNNGKWLLLDYFITIYWQVLETCLSLRRTSQVQEFVASHSIPLAPWPKMCCFIGENNEMMILFCRGLVRWLSSNLFIDLFLCTFCCNAIFYKILAKLCGLSGPLPSFTFFHRCQSVNKCWLLVSFIF